MTTRELVESLLEADTITRTDDNYLYGRVVEQLAKRNGIYNTDVDYFVKVMCGAHLPSIHTVVRERQFIQKQKPELVDDKTAKRRFYNEKVFREKYRHGATDE